MACAPSSIVAFLTTLPSRGIPGGALGCGRLGTSELSPDDVASCCAAAAALSANRCLCAPEVQPLLQQFPTTLAAAAAGAPSK